MEDRFPREALFEKFFSEKILFELGVTSKEDLFFEKGSFKVLKKINEIECFKELEYDKPQNFDFENNLPKGGIGIIDKNSINGKGKKGRPLFSGTGFDSGHILGKQLFQGKKGFDARKNNRENIYKQTKWSNRGNHHTAAHGYNQTYYENVIVYQIREKTPEAIIKYRADLIYDLNDKIAKGIHIRSSCEQNELLNFNVFVPNVEVEGIINFKEDKLLILKKWRSIRNESSIF